MHELGETFGPEIKKSEGVYGYMICGWVKTSAPRAVWPRIWGRGEERQLGRGLGWLVTASMCVEIPGEIVRIRKRDLVERSVLARASSVK